MRNLLLLGLTLTVTSRLLSAHVAGPTVDLTVVNEAGIATKPSFEEKRPVVFYLSLIDKKTKRPLENKDLLVVHEQKFHLFGFDRGLTNYLHVHPIPVEGRPDVWRVTLTFPQTGTYKLWANICRKDLPVPDHANMPGMAEHDHPAGEEMDGTELEVTGASLPSKTPATLPVKLTARAGHSTLKLADISHPAAGKLPLIPDATQMILMQFSRDDGKAPHIVNYLGAPAHVTITNLKGDHLIHAHPMMMGGKLMLHTSFPEAGDYRLFIQFIDRQTKSSSPEDPPADLKTVELAVHVDSDLD